MEKYVPQNLLILNIYIYLYIGFLDAYKYFQEYFIINIFLKYIFDISPFFKFKLNMFNLLIFLPYTKLYDFLSMKESD
jgi:hypothetical protein